MREFIGLVVGTTIICVGLYSMRSPQAEAKLRPEHRAYMDDMSAVSKSVGDIEEVLHIGLQQCQRARAGIGNGRTGDAAQEFAALANTAKEIDRRVAAASKPLKKVDDGNPDEIHTGAYTSSTSGDLSSK